jgi:hypothetical protein
MTEYRSTSADVRRYSFSSTEYSSDAKGHIKRLPIWKAILDALNPTDIIMGILRIFPLCVQLSRSGDWKQYRLAMRESGLQGAVRKGVRKYRGRKSQVQSPDLHSNTGMEALGRHSDSISMSGGLGYEQMYQPPEASPSQDAQGYLLADMNARGRPRSASEGHLMADAVPPGRPRASSQSSLMAEAHLHEDRSQLYGRDQRYGQSRSPSPSRFIEAPMNSREMV